MFFSLFHSSLSKKTNFVNQSALLSSQSCVICGPKCTSRALCSCCQQYLYRDHLQEHDNLLNCQLESLVDNINELSNRLKQCHIDSFLQPILIQLYQWKQAAYQSIERIYEQNSNEINQFIDKQLDYLDNKNQLIDINTSYSTISSSPINNADCLASLGCIL